MIQLDLKSGLDFRLIQAKLGSTPLESKKILKQAINATAKKTLPMTGEHAQKTYDVKKEAFNKGKGKYADVKIKNASNSRLEAQILFSGHKLELIQYKTNPAGAVDPRNPPDMVRGHVLKSNGLKPIIKNGQKGFIVKYKSGHITVAARNDKKRLPIKTIYSPSIPQIVGSKKLLSSIKNEVSEILYTETNKRMDKFLRKKAKQGA